MRRTISVLLIAILSHCAAHAARHTKPQGWGAIQSTHAGALLVIFPENPAEAETCRMTWADDAAVSCIPGESDGTMRLIFPRSVVRAVWIIEPDQGSAKGVLIAAGIGFALGGALCAAGGPGGVILCGSLGAGFMGSMFAENGPAMPPGYGYGPRRYGPARYPRVPRFRRRLLYASHP